MQDYRAYIIGRDGHVQRSVDIQCVDVTEAVRLAKQLVDGHDVELWQSDRRSENIGGPTASRPSALFAPLGFQTRY
jgi:hypothetical protein